MSSGRKPRRREDGKIYRIHRDRPSEDSTPLERWRAYDHGGFCRWSGHESEVIWNLPRASRSERETGTENILEDLIDDS